MIYSFVYCSCGMQDSSKQFTAVKSQLQKLQQQLWDREKENVQLQFQYEQAVVDLPRLQVSTSYISCLSFKMFSFSE